MDTLNTELNERWEKTKVRIKSYLEEILLKIEWHYGECRAPFMYPPEFDLTFDDKTEFVCIIKLDPIESGELRYSAEDPNELFAIIKSDIDEKYLVN